MQHDLSSHRGLLQATQQHLHAHGGKKRSAQPHPDRCRARGQPDQHPAQPRESKQRDHTGDGHGTVLVDPCVCTADAPERPSRARRTPFRVASPELNGEATMNKLSAAPSSKDVMVSVNRQPLQRPPTDLALPLRTAAQRCIRRPTSSLNWRPRLAAESVPIGTFCSAIVHTKPDRYWLSQSVPIGRVGCGKGSARRRHSCCGVLWPEHLLLHRSKLTVALFCLRQIAERRLFVGESGESLHPHQLPIETIPLGEQAEGQQAEQETHDHGRSQHCSSMASL